MTTLEIAVPELVKRYQAGEIPASARATVTYEPEIEKDPILAKLHQWQSETQTQTTPEVSTRELFDQWAQEDANMTEEQRQAESQLWEEFEKGINENRAVLGMRQL